MRVAKDLKMPVLKSITTVTLQTYNGVRLFDGRYDAHMNVPGLYRYANKMAEAWADAKNRRLLTKLFLLQAEQKLDDAERGIKRQLERLKVAYDLPNYDISPIVELSIKRKIISVSPYPYRAGQLIVLADLGMLKAIVYCHNGILTVAEAKQTRHQLAVYIRRIFEHANLYIKAVRDEARQKIIDSKLHNRLGGVPEDVIVNLAKPKWCY